MAYLLIVLILFISVFLFFGTSSNQGNKSNKTKDAIKEYLSNFNMYLCIRNKLLLFPPKELNIMNKGYYTLNLSTHNNILRHRNINASAFSKDTQNCSECLYHCPLGSDDIVSLKLTFDQFRTLTNDELLKHLQEILTEDQFNRLFK